jgi:hypothetical protein
MGFPVEIKESDLREVTSVLRCFSRAVRDEIVGACLLTRPKDYHAYQYDYSKSGVLTLRCGVQVCSAAVVTLRVINPTTRCLEVSWVATLRDYRKRGHAAMLFGYVQQIAAIMGIEAVLVLSSRTSVGYWLTQPRAPGSARIIMVRHKHSEKRLTKGYSKMDPRKLQKLEAGLRRSEVYDHPPDSVSKFYSKDSPFRFDHARSIHVWYLMGLAHVDYLSLAKSGSVHQQIPLSVRSSSARAGERPGKLRVDSTSSSSTNLQKKFLKSTLSAQLRQKVNQGGSGSSPQRSRSLPSSPPSPHRLNLIPDGSSSDSGSGSGGDGIKRSNSLNSRLKKSSPYKVQNVTSAKLMATKLRMKAKKRSFQSIPLEMNRRSKSQAVPQTT